MVAQEIDQINGIGRKRPLLAYAARSSPRAQYNSGNESFGLQIGDWQVHRRPDRRGSRPAVKLVNSTASGNAKTLAGIPNAPWKHKEDYFQSTLTSRFEPRASYLLPDRAQRSVNYIFSAKNAIRVGRHASSHVVSPKEPWQTPVASEAGCKAGSNKAPTIDRMYLEQNGGSGGREEMDGIFRVTIVISLLPGNTEQRTHGFTARITIPALSAKAMQFPCRHGGTGMLKGCPNHPVEEASDPPHFTVSKSHTRSIHTTISGYSSDLRWDRDTAPPASLYFFTSPTLNTASPPMADRRSGPCYYCPIGATYPAQGLRRIAQNVHRLL
ncbi:hypothetical protein FB451DRAFT_1162444 [Mycena latifolia]|nr:hypothetical protein FB451DRAFT_1162444 [Mycena latifolia]